MTQFYIHIYIYILFQILFPYRLLQDIEYSSLLYTVNPCCLSFIYGNVHLLITCSQFIPSSHPFPFGNHRFVFYVKGQPLDPLNKMPRMLTRSRKNIVSLWSLLSSLSPSCLERRRHPCFPSSREMQICEGEEDM